jgi:hypothetical protein
MIPHTIDPETESHAERLLFRLFSTELPQEFTILHSVRFVFLDSKRRVQDGEIDFLIVHPDLGLLILEVKGGKIFFSGSHDGGGEAWFSESRNGQQHRLKRSPMSQAHEAMRNLMTKINQATVTATFKYGHARAVAFPDVVTSGTNWGIDVLPQQVIGSQHLGDIESAIRKAYGTPFVADRITRKLRDALINLLKPSGAVEQLGLMNEIKTNEMRIKQLSEEQYGLISFLQGQPRAVINGCAGSGKTMLALEKARSLASQGFDVLLTCYNKGLSSWLRRNVELFGPGISERIVVAHFHDLAVSLCNEAGLPIDVAGRMREKNFWDEVVPTQFFETIPHIERRFDAIVADEGQDFDADWWVALQQLLHDPERGVFYIFRDEQQDLYGRDPALPFPEHAYSLTANHRNSRQIHTLTTSYFEGDPKPESLGPAGREPEFVAASDPNLLATLGGVLQRLIVNEGIPPDRIVVLTPRGKGTSLLPDGHKLANRTLSWDDSPTAESIRVATIYGFKGLESDVVILAESNHLLHRTRWKELCYVALTRARHHLIVLGDLPAGSGTFD